MEQELCEYTPECSKPNIHVSNTHIQNFSFLSSVFSDFIPWMLRGTL